MSSYSTSNGCISNSGAYCARVSPGAQIWRRQPDGGWVVTHSAFGGSGGGSRVNAQQVAAGIARLVAEGRALRHMRQLGWVEVAAALPAAYAAIREEQSAGLAAAWQEREQRMRADFGRYRGWTYQDFRNLVYEHFIAAGGTEEDCSVRRMHQAALNWMSYARSVDELEARERGGPVP